MSYTDEPVHFEALVSAEVTEDGELRVRVCCPRCRHEQDLVVSRREVTDDYEIERPCANALMCGEGRVRYTFLFKDNCHVAYRMFSGDAGPVAPEDLDLCWVHHKGIGDEPLFTKLHYHCPVCGDIESEPLPELEVTKDGITVLRCQRHPQGAEPFQLSVHTHGQLRY